MFTPSETPTSDTLVLESLEDLRTFWMMTRNVQWVSTFDGEIVAANPAFVNALGYTAQELRSLTPRDLVHPEDLDAVTARMATADAGEELGGLEFRLVTKSGQSIWLDVLSRRVAAQRLTYSSARDTTAQKALESALAEQVARLEELNQELDAFAYSVSHDLRAPLRAIDGFSAVLVREYSDQLDDQGKDRLQRVRAAAQRMGSLIDGMLSLSRVTRGALNKQPVDVTALAEAVAAELASAEPERSVVLQVEAGLRASGDPGLVRAALQNLIGNAWKFTAQRSPARIEVGQRRHDDGIAFYVRDNGAGFDMQYAEKLFTPFQRLHRQDEFAGNGIGLATVHRIVRRHGGRIWVDSAPDQGATFYFTLPADEAR